MLLQVERQLLVRLHLYALLLADVSLRNAQAKQKVKCQLTETCNRLEKAMFPHHSASQKLNRTRRKTEMRIRSKTTSRLHRHRPYPKMIRRGLHQLAAHHHLLRPYTHSVQYAAPPNLRDKLRRWKPRSDNSSERGRKIGISKKLWTRRSSERVARGPVD